MVLFLKSLWIYLVNFMNCTLVKVEISTGGSCSYLILIISEPPMYDDKKESILNLELVSEW